MNKRIICMMLMLVMILASAAVAEDTAAVPSITIAEVILPAGEEIVTEEGEGFIIFVAPIIEDSAPKAVFDKIAEVVQVKEEPVAVFFGEVVMETVVELLPEETVVENLIMDEFFVLDEEGYVNEYGDIEAVFSFATEYEDDVVLVAMIGLLPSEEEIAAALAAAEEAGEAENFDETSLIEWIPIGAEAAEGKVKINFTVEVLEQLKEREVVIALLREDAVTADVVTEEAE